MRYSPDELATLLRYAKDASGHEHKGKGPGGGQFTGTGEGQSPDAMAQSLSGGAKPASRDDMLNFLVEEGIIGPDDEPTDEQLTALYTKAKGGGQAPAAPTTAKPGQRMPNTLTSAGTYHDGFLPTAGQTISYYDGEGGVSRAAPITGKVLGVDPKARNQIRVMTRTGNMVWIPAEATMPPVAKG